MAAPIINLALAALLCLVTLAAPTYQPQPVFLVPGAGTFTTHLSLDFRNLTSLPPSLHISTYPVPSSGAPFSHHFSATNVHLANDSLVLSVPGGSTGPSIASAEVTTAFDDILYGSVRVVASHDGVPGTCKGLFFYRSDQQETDVEILTNDVRNISGVWFTNQKVDVGAEATTSRVAAPKGGGWHEYRTDWVPGSTKFYIDGVLKGGFQSNVASEPSAFVLNNWSNGDVEWSAGPPTQTSKLKIRSIVGFFNRTGDGD